MASLPGNPPPRVHGNATVLPGTASTLRRAYPNASAESIRKALVARGAVKNAQGRWEGPITVREYKAAYPAVSERALRDMAREPRFASARTRAEAAAMRVIRDRGWLDSGRSTTKRPWTFPSPVEVLAAVDDLVNAGVPEYLVDIRRTGPNAWVAYIDHTS